MYYMPDMAFLAGSVGAGEWIMLFAVVLVVVGPRRLPEVARKFGRTMEMFRRAADEFKEQLMSMDQEINKNVSDASGSTNTDGVDGDEGADDSYEPSYDYDEGAYDNDSDYPGNEDIVAEWESGSESTALERDELTQSETKPDANENTAVSEDSADAAAVAADLPETEKAVAADDSDSTEKKS